MKTVIWGAAILIDALAFLLTLDYLVTGTESALQLFGGILVITNFGALLCTLAVPSRVMRFSDQLRRPPIAAALSLLVPVVALVDAFDFGTISDREWIAFVVALLIGWLNWSAFKLRFCARNAA